MTFLFSFLALNAVEWTMRRLSPKRDRPGFRKLLVFGVFLSIPALVMLLGYFVMPKLIAQGQRFASWISQMNPETEIARAMESIVGPMEFRREFGGPNDPRYQKAIADFESTGNRFVAEYLEFPKLESWIDSGFQRQFAESFAARERARLSAEGTSTRDFQAWLTRDSENNSANSSPRSLNQLHQKWISESISHSVANAKSSPEYHEQYRKYYDQLRTESPSVAPYTFEQFQELRAARLKGQKAFGDAMNRECPTKAANLHADFEYAKQHEMFDAWWGSSTAAKFVRNRVESGVAESASARAEHMLSRLIDVPIDIATALLLSFFVCIDFPRMRRSLRTLDDTWLHDVYAELAPALADLAQLVGRALQAQGLIAVCNATMMFVALSILGVEHALALSAIVFLLCLVPTLGMIIAWVLLATVALVQPGGGIALALKVSFAVFAIVALEIFVFSPRILGRMMELHPVLIIAILPVAQYFFGIWGLILATPIAVFVINNVIFERPHLANSDSNPPLA